MENKKFNIENANLGDQELEHVSGGGVRGVMKRSVSYHVGQTLFKKEDDQELKGVNKNHLSER